MHRLVYYSANRILGGPSDIRAQIDDILETSRFNNQQVGLTGALIFSSGFFGQILEGSQNAIEATFERIQQDPRHGDVSLLEFSAIETRIFVNWSMAFVGAADDAFSDWSNKGFDFGALTAEVLISRLRDLVSHSVRTV